MRLTRRSNLSILVLNLLISLTGSSILLQLIFNKPFQGYIPEFGAYLIIYVLWFMLTAPMISIYAIISKQKQLVEDDGRKYLFYLAAKRLLILSVPFLFASIVWSLPENIIESNDYLGVILLVPAMVIGLIALIPGSFIGVLLDEANISGFLFMDHPIELGFLIGSGLWSTLTLGITLLSLKVSKKE